MSILKLSNGVTIATQARAKNLTFNNGFLNCELEDGRIISVPLSWYPRLASADPNALGNWQLIGKGEGIHWMDLDEDLSVRAFLAGCHDLEWSEPRSQYLTALIGTAKNIKHQVLFVPRLIESAEMEEVQKTGTIMART